jgi:hypothetical protein
MKLAGNEMAAQLQLSENEQRFSQAHWNKCRGKITGLYQVTVWNNYSVGATKSDAVLTKSTFSSEIKYQNRILAILSTECASKNGSGEKMKLNVVV